MSIEEERLFVTMARKAFNTLSCIDESQMQCRFCKLQIVTLRNSQILNRLNYPIIDQQH